MLLNYTKLAIRLLRNPFFTFINVVGLSIGYTAAKGNPVEALKYE